MKLFLYLTDMIVPFMIFAILAYGVQKKVRVYDTFIEGAREGLLTVVKIVPTLIGLMTAVGILRASGFLDFWQELWEVLRRHRVSRGAGPAFSCKNVFFVRCHRTFAGCV